MLCAGCQAVIGQPRDSLLRNNRARVSVPMFSAPTLAAPVPRLFWRERTRSGLCRSRGRRRGRGAARSNERTNMSSDLYADLQISKGASAEEVKPAYRKLARQLHPDKNADEQVGTTMLCPPSVGGVYLPRASCVWADLTHAGAHGGAFQEGQSRVLDPFRPRAAHRLRSQQGIRAADREQCARPPKLQPPAL